MLSPSLMVGRRERFPTYFRSLVTTVTRKELYSSLPKFRFALNTLSLCVGAGATAFAFHSMDKHSYCDCASSNDQDEDKNGDSTSGWLPANLSNILSEAKGCFPAGMVPNSSLLDSQVPVKLGYGFIMVR